MTDVGSLVRHPWSRVLLAVALPVGAFAYLMAYPPTLQPSDESFILYDAKRLWQGDILYRDFFDFLMPGTFYFYALVYAVAGPTITAARGATALLNAGSCALTYLLARHVSAPSQALLAAAAFIVGMVPAWNISGHHWLATLLSLATAAVVLARRWRDSSRARPALAGGLAAALVCSHQGRGAWIVLWLAIVVPLLAWAGSPRGSGRRMVRESCWAALGAVAVAAPMLGWAVWRASLREVMYATLPWVVERYGRLHVGTVQWAGSFDVLGEKPHSTWLWLLRAIPALLGVEALALGGAIVSEGLRPHVVRASLFLLAVFTACSIFYFPDYIHVATIAPFSLVVLAGLAHRLGSALVTIQRPAVTAAWRLCWVLVAAAVLVKGAGNLSDAWARTPVLFPTAFGTLAANENGAKALRDLQAELAKRGNGHPRLFAYPGDAWFYLATPADNPTPFSLLKPNYNTPAQFETAIASLRQDPSAFVVVSWVFVGPNDPIMELIGQEYEPVAGLGPALAFGLYGQYLYARRDRPSDGPS